ncbi:folate-binding Fe/S cluster repair protein [Catenovulum sp. SM1970]|uniref:CAF17-like 4Fe-4S cluster assembly/insertion protein YgfZ n=1 Tax=Marinifaba aquimaris TaxID=2741323 RepID=UPI001572408D|nr:folate-binding Fe/S cluster repair protein [Marinifaba aquimaris]NTS76431.1 folate-binding Fe/S cluster repair protein [Marinifaba aquimaris]
MSETHPLIIKLDNFGSIGLVGEDSQTYLNSQVTCAVKELAEDQASFSAHTDAKGKSWSHFYLVPIGDALQLFQRKNTIERSAGELNKYGVFSKTDITDDSDILAWYAIINAPKAPLHQVFNEDGVYRVQLAEHIDLIALTPDSKLPASLSELTQGEEVDFEHALIQAGIGFLHQQHQVEYVPQMLNLHALDGISFKKGCYMGQETIARMRYLGKNKRALMPFSGTATSLKLDDTLELKNGDAWRRAGTVVCLAQKGEQFFGLAVVAADIAIDSQLRVKDDDNSQLSLSPLPYSLEYKES